MKGNQPGLAEDIAALGLERKPPDFKTEDKGHGRVEIRENRVSAAVNDNLDFPHAGQVFCIKRYVFDCKKKTQREETVYGITDRKPSEASPEEMLRINRGHWGIENRSHYVRDVTYDEDRSQIRARNGPQAMACLRNFAIGTLRAVRRAGNIASALRDMAARPHTALLLPGL